jgi:cytochrome c oxidase assembly factor CtaG
VVATPAPHPLPGASEHGSLLAHATPGNLPEPLTTSTAWTAWTFELVPVVGIVAVAALYLYGVSRLRSRGDRWPWWRTVFFVPLGLGTIALAMTSALATYDTVLFSVHMIQHMLLAMIAPIFLACGAPVTLALRTLPPGPRGVLLTVIHSRVAAFFTHPLVAGTIFVLNPFVLYFSGLYEATLRNPWLHDLNHLHFVLVGCLWYFPLLGVDPMPRRMPYPARLFAAFATMPFHAALGVFLMGAQPLTGEAWYLSLNREWGPSPLTDQRWGGGLLWATGEAVAVLVFSVIFVQWVVASGREARRTDRALDRAEESGGGELAAYNAALAALAEQDERRRT